MLPAARDDRADEREILIRVGPEVHVAEVVGRRPVVAEVDPEVAVPVDGVTTDRVTDRCVLDDRDPVAAVEGDDVAGVGDGASDLVVHRVEQRDAREGVPEGQCSRDVGSDLVADDEVQVGSSEDDACPRVSRDDVPGGRPGAADDVAVAVVEEEPVGAVRDGDRARDVGADGVALDEEAGGRDGEAAEDVSGDHVAGARAGAADEAVRGRREGVNPLAIAERGGAVAVRPDEVPSKHVPVQKVEDDAADLVPGDEVPVGGIGAADRVVGRFEGDAVVVGQRCGPGDVRPDEVSGDHVASGSADVDGDREIAVEPVHDEAPDHAAAPDQVEARRGGGEVGPVDLDHEHGVVAVGERVRRSAGLGVAVDRDGPQDERELRGERDGVRARTGYVELDGVGERRIARVDDRVSQGALGDGAGSDAGVGGRVDDENLRRRRSGHRRRQEKPRSDFHRVAVTADRTSGR